MLFDTHAHLNDPDLEPLADEIVSSMEADGLGWILNVGYDRKTSEKAVAQANAYSAVYAAVGIHPHDSGKRTPDDYNCLRELAKSPKVAAFGEIGLDFYYDNSPRDEQEKAFCEQLEIADALGLPVVLHIRDAYGKALQILSENRRYLSRGGIMHCYLGSKEMIGNFAELGFYFAFGGVITFKNANKEEVVKAVPHDRLLLETDCPYMAPVPHRGQINLPKYIAYVAAKASEWLGEDAGELAANNAKRILRIN